MGHVGVALAPASALGRLFPTYFRDVDLIFLRSRVERPIVHTVNLLSHIFLGADEEGSVARIGILASRGLWTIDDAFSGWEAHFPSARPVRDADLYLLPASMAQAAYGADELTLSITTDADLSCILILFDAPHGRVEPIQLSPLTLAFVSEHRLLGFFLSLTGARNQAMRSTIARRAGVLPAQEDQESRPAPGDITLLL